MPIESFGALLIDIRDNSGTRYTLAPGRTSTIRIPLGTLSPAPPATIPLFFFDESTGLWREEGTATLQGTAPNRYYEGTVTRFSYWNADQVFDTVFISGCVRDTNDQPVGNLLVETIGINYSGRALVITASDGTFRVGMRQNSLATLSAIEFNLQTFTSQLVTNVVHVDSSLVDFTVPDCLVKGATPVTITTSATLPGGKVGIAYNQTLAATGGVPGYSWSLNPGSSPLPVGLSLNPSGVISGVATTAGTAIITVKVTDSVAGTTTKQLSLTISPVGTPVAITSPSLLPAGTVGTAYSTTLAASGGTGALSWSVVSGTMPVGVTLNPSTGQLSGTPTTPGTSTFTIQVKDSGTPQQSDGQAFTLSITRDGGVGTLTMTNAPASINSPFVPDAQRTQTAALFNEIIINWAGRSANPNFSDTMEVRVNLVTGATSVFFLARSTTGIGDWFCSMNCQGVTVNRISRYGNIYQCGDRVGSDHTGCILSGTDFAERNLEIYAVLKSDRKSYPREACGLIRRLATSEPS